MMACRAGCGACCTALSISSAIPGMPDGKPAGVRCVQLADDGLCRIFGQPQRPVVCSAFQADPEFCGEDSATAFERLQWLEAATAVDPSTRAGRA